jgi:predicted phosphodiesterase
VPSDATLYTQHKAGQTYTELAAAHGLKADSVRGRVSRERRRVLNLTASTPTISETPPAPPSAYFQYLLLRKAIKDAPVIVAEPAPGPVDDSAHFDTLVGNLSKLSRAVRVLYASDHHIPDHDPQALRMVEEIALWFGPDLIVHGGDVFDMDAISRFQKDFRKGKPDAMRHARKPYTDHVQRLKTDNPNAAQLYLDGNHTAPRMDAYLADNWEFQDAILDTYQALVRANGAVLYMGAVEEVEIGSLFMQHGRRVGKYAARNAQDDLGGSTPMVQGHAHSLQMDVRRVRRPGGRGYRVVQSIVNGCLCQIPASYTPHTKQSKWLQSITLAHVEMDGDLVNLQPVVFHQRTNGNLCAFIGKKFFEVGANAEARPVLTVERKVA